jgi:predicted nuclease with TOPRIM domain
MDHAEVIKHLEYLRYEFSMLRLENKKIYESQTLNYNESTFVQEKLNELEQRLEHVEWRTSFLFKEVFGVQPSVPLGV